MITKRIKTTPLLMFESLAVRAVEFEHSTSKDNKCENLKNESKNCNMKA